MWSKEEILQYAQDDGEREARDDKVKDSGATIATYTYDALNRRVSKETTRDGKSTVYYYADDQVVEEYENGLPKRNYVYGRYKDDVVAMVVDSHTYYYLKDRQYNIVELRDTTGSLVESYAYTAFGKMSIKDKDGNLRSQSTVANPYGFTGRRYDSESNLQYYRNRMYSAELGRFLQRDPNGFIDGLNLYAYCNAPLIL